MDFLSPAGFLNLASYYRYHLSDPSQTHWVFQLPRLALRLCLWVVMGMPPDSLLMAAPDCSSWGLPARGTSLRSWINPCGNIFLQWVRRSNCMMSRNLSLFIIQSNLLKFQNSNHGLGGVRTCDPRLAVLRTVMCCLVALANNCIWVLEQPSNSLAGQWNRLDWMVNHVAWVLWYGFIIFRPPIQFSFNMDMGSYGEATAHIAFPHAEMLRCTEQSFGCRNMVQPHQNALFYGQWWRRSQYLIWVCSLNRNEKRKRLDKLFANMSMLLANKDLLEQLTFQRHRSWDHTMRDHVY